MTYGRVLAAMLGASLLARLAVGCSGQLSAESAEGGAGAFADGSVADGSASDRSAFDGSVDGSLPEEYGPYRVTCSVYHRALGGDLPPPEHQRTPIVFRTDEVGERSLVLANTDIPVRAKLAARDGSDDVVLTLSFPRSNLTGEFQLPRNRRPTFEFGGYHGFSGLHYVSTPGSSVDVQYICEASPLDEPRPKPFPPPPTPSGTEPSPAPPPPIPRQPTPVHVRCDATVSEPSGPHTESIRVDGKTDQTIVVAGHGVRIVFYDDPYDGRSMVLQLGSKERAENWVLQQLLQFDRSAPMVNPTQGSGGLTGRATLAGEVATDGGGGDAGASGSVTVSCTVE